MAIHGGRSARSERCRSHPTFTRGSLILVIDASVAFNACLVERGFDLFKREKLIAPPLLWSETRSALHESVWRGELKDAEARIAIGRLDAAGVAARSPKGLGSEAWRLATSLGWAKTYDAEYLALASLMRCRLVTKDEALWRATAHLGFVIGPTKI